MKSYYRIVGCGMLGATIDSGVTTCPCCNGDHHPYADPLKVCGECGGAGLAKLELGSGARRLLFEAQLDALGKGSL